MDECSNDVSDRDSPPVAADDGEIVPALSIGSPIADAGLLAAIRSRIDRSIDDPRPSLTLSEVDDFIGALVARARADGERA